MQTKYETRLESDQFAALAAGSNLAALMPPPSGCNTNPVGTG
jgi:hypothetical protein